MGKKHKHDHEEHLDESWLIPYADLLTLLLALFIVLFASSESNEKKMEKMRYSLRAALDGGNGFFQNMNPITSDSTVNEAIRSQKKTGPEGEKNDQSIGGSPVAGQKDQKEQPMPTTELEKVIEEENIKEASEFKEIKSLKDLQKLKETRELKELDELKELKELQELKKLKESKELQELKDQNDQGKLDELKEMKKQTAQLNELQKKLEAYIEKKGLTAQLKTELDSQQLKIVISDTTLFASGSATLKPGSRSIAIEISKMLESYKAFEVVVGGHTDDRPIKTAEFSSNFQLSTQRALNFMSVILENKKVGVQRFWSAGYGEYKPVVSNDTEAGRARNRRVEVSVIRTVK